MKLKFEKSELLNGLQIVEKAIPKHTMQPVLECVVIDATKDKVKLNTYDGDMSICCTVDGDIQQEGMSAIDAKILVPIIKKMPDGEVTITVKDDATATIKGGRVKFDVPCRSADDFPTLPMVDIFSNTVTMSQYTLKEAIRTTIFSCGDVASTNKAMSGELFELSGDRLTIVSLDGHRIAIRNSDLRKSYDPAKVIIPGKALAEIIKILSGDVEEDVTIALEDKVARKPVASIVLQVFHDKEQGFFLNSFGESIFTFLSGIVDDVVDILLIQRIEVPERIGLGNVFFQSHLETVKSEGLHKVVYDT